MRKLLWRSAALITLLIVCLSRVDCRGYYRQSEVDEARPADVILVLGAAEYRGKPSPVLRARLDHALTCISRSWRPAFSPPAGRAVTRYSRKAKSPEIILCRRGVPSEDIILESEGESTMHSTAAAAEIMRRMNLKSCIVVSDGTTSFG